MRQKGEIVACGMVLTRNHCSSPLQEVDAAPDFAGFLILQSVAGGTGSGLGTLRHGFPELHLTYKVWLLC